VTGLESEYSAESVTEIVIPRCCYSAAMCYFVSLCLIKQEDSFTLIPLESECYNWRDDYFQCFMDRMPIEMLKFICKKPNG